MVVRHIFIVGSKGIPGRYGGFETFVDKLTEYHQNHDGIAYHVACKDSRDGEFRYHNARCFQVKTADIGPAQAVIYDLKALMKCCDDIKKYQIQKPVVYVLACRIGPLAAYFQRKIHRLGGVLYVNPDGHEWRRAKWSRPVRWYWRLSERLMVKSADLLVCDSKHIQQYIKKAYRSYRPRTTFIAYGATPREQKTKDAAEDLQAWYQEKSLAAKSYYLTVGRFVPENNYETIIREFMRSDTKRSLVLITDTNAKYLRELEQQTGFAGDRRIKFVGTVYDQELLAQIRENAYAYCHGHEVGGTNPSLLEALSCTDINLLFNVGFNREVARDSAFYWNKSAGSLTGVIAAAERLNADEIQEWGEKARKRIADAYAWEHIAKRYETLFRSAGAD